MQEELIKKIEELNLEIIDLKNSSEYKIGSDIVKAKKTNIFKTIKKIIDRKKVAKYNAHSELDNGYNTSETILSEKPKVAIYSCVTNGYDNIKEPFIKMENTDYYLFTDSDNITSGKWNIKQLTKETEKFEGALKNRYIKMHPYELFKEYDYAIYIDGNVKVMSDLTELVNSINEKTGISMHRHKLRNCIYDEIKVCKIRHKGNYEKLKEQAERYKKEGFPEKFGMLEATIIVTDLKNENGKMIYKNWWDELISSESLRDQISLPYILWKNNLQIQDIGNLGNNLYKNPKFRVGIH